MPIFRQVSPALDGASVDLGTSRLRHLSIPAGEYATPFWLRFDGDPDRVEKVSSLPWRAPRVAGSLEVSSVAPAAAYSLPENALAGGTSTTARFNAQREADRLDSWTDGSGVLWQVAYYANDAGPNHVLSVRNDQGFGVWTSWSTYTIVVADTTDTHHWGSVGIDPDGFVWLAQNMHNDPLDVRKTVHALDDPAFDGTTSTVASLTGNGESQVTYLRWHRLGGTLYCSHRGNGGAGNADWYLKAYDEVAGTWSAALGLTGAKLLDGTTDAQSPNLDHEPVLDAQGNWVIGWNWRGTTAPSSSHNRELARYDVAAGQFQDLAGNALTTPIRQGAATLVEVGVTNDLETVWVDSQGRPHVAYKEQDGSNQWRIVHAYWDGSAIQTSVAFSTTHTDDVSADGGSNLSSPQIIVDGSDRAHIYFTVDDDDNAISKVTADPPYSSWSGRQQLWAGTDLGYCELRCDVRRARDDGEVWFCVTPWDASDPAAGFPAYLVLAETH